MGHQHHTSGAAHTRLGRPPIPGERDLLLRLDAWCRQNGLPTTGNRSIAVAALHDPDLAHPWRDVQIAIAPEAREGQPLGPDPRRWPAAARYRLAELERGGLERRSALRAVRAERQGPTAPDRHRAAAGGAQGPPLRQRRTGRRRRTTAAADVPASRRSGSDVG